MTIFGSKAFIERFDCTVSWPDEKPVQGQAMDAWSGELLKVYRAGQAAVMMHDASLATLIVPLKGVRHFDVFLPIFLRRVSDMLGSLGRGFDPANQSVVVLRRNNRSLIGSMNNVKELIEFTMFDQIEKGVPIDWNKAEHFINHTPFSLIDYEMPMEKLASLIARGA